MEVGGGLLHFFPRTNKIGVALLASALLGAMIAHAKVLRDPIYMVVPLALLVAVVLVAARDPKLDLIARSYWRDA